MRRQGGVLWRHSDFLKFWAGETISLVGSQITIFALPLVAVLTLNATPAQVGVLNAVAFAPFLLMTLPAGVWIDRLRRRPIMIVTNLGRAVLLGLIPLLAFIGQLRIEYLYVIVFLSGVLTVFFQLAYQAYLPSLVEPDQIGEGNSKLATTTSIAELGGPGIGSLLVAVFTTPFALVIDALSYLLAAGALSTIRKPEPEPDTSKHRSTLRHDIAHGLRLTLGNPLMRAFAGEAATYNFFWSMMQTVFVLYIVRELGLRQEIYGSILIAGSSGALVGALATNRIARRLGIGATIIAMAVLGDIAPLLIPLAAGPTIVMIGLMMTGAFLQGFGTTASNIHILSIRQIITPDWLRGRVNASYRLIVSGMYPIGALLGGWLGESIGLRFTLLTATIGLLSTWLWIWFSPVPQLQTLPTSADELFIDTVDQAPDATVRSSV
jgi:MFS family permease